MFDTLAAVQPTEEIIKEAAIPEPKPKVANSQSKPTISNTAPAPISTQDFL